MAVREPTKQVKRLLSEYAAEAHEEELRRALLPLADAFDEWRAGRISSGEISDRIHSFHQGPSRELFSMYNSQWLGPAVAGAISRGILKRDEVPEELLDHLSGLLAFAERDVEEAGG